MLADEYARLGLPSNTEVIVGLPGETFKSHKSTLASLLESGIDAVIAYNLMLLNGTEMGTDAHREKYGVKVLAYGHAQDNENKIYQVLEVESMEKMQEGMADPELAKLRTDAGVKLDTQEIVFLVE